MNNVVLIVSGQSFTDSEKVFDGLRLRTVGIAAGLSTNGLKVIVAFHGPEEFQFSRDGVVYTTWTTFDSFVSIVSKYRFILFNYATLGLNRILLNILRSDQILISDGIVPIALEESARAAKNSAEDMDACLKLIHRSDAVLISSKSCQEYYSKINSDFQRLSKEERKDPQFILLPFGVNSYELVSAPIENTNYIEEKLRLVWYGGVYPWFGVTELERLISELGFEDSFIELTLVGVSNPFTLDSQLSEITSRILNSAARSIHVRTVSWLPYETRLMFLSKFDAAIFFNDSSQLETKYSWRQRYTDLVLARLPLIINSIDPFSRLMIHHGVAGEIESDLILRANRDESTRSAIIEEIRRVREEGNWDLIAEYLSWTKVTLQLSNWIIGKID